MGNHGNPEAGAIGVAAGHCQADAIHRHAGLFAHIAAVGGVLPGQLQAPGGGLAGDRSHNPQPIHMAAHQVAAEPVGQAQGRLEIHSAAPVCLGGQGGAAQGFLTDIGAEAIGQLPRHGETNPIHRHAVAQGQVRWGPASPRSCSPLQLDPVGRAANHACGLHQPGKHLLSSPGRFILAIIGQKAAPGHG